MWWGIGVALVLLIPLMAFYLFAAARLRTASRSAPRAARDILWSAARSFLANAMQKLGIMIILLFVGLRDDAMGFHVVWMAFVVLMPVAYMAREARRRKSMNLQLDAESQDFMKTLDRFPMRPWQQRIGRS